MQKHQWHVEEEEGRRYWRGEHHGGRWRLLSRWEDEEEWTEHDPISEDEWRALREVLFRKYQRGRCPWKLIERIDQLLGDDA